jgi:hypothetical protein
VPLSGRPSKLGCRRCGGVFEVERAEPKSA